MHIITRENVYDQYIMKNKTVTQCAEYFGCSIQKMSVYIFTKYGIKKFRKNNKKSWAKKNQLPNRQYLRTFATEYLENDVEDIFWTEDSLEEFRQEQKKKFNLNSK